MLRLRAAAFSTLRSPSMAKKSNKKATKESENKTEDDDSAIVSVGKDVLVTCQARNDVP